MQTCVFSFYSLVMSNINKQEEERKKKEISGAELLIYNPLLLKTPGSVIQQDGFFPQD